MRFSISSLMRGAVAGAALSVVLVPLAANAGTLSEAANVASTPTNWTQSLNFSGFNALATAASLNPSALILNSVTIALTETMAGTAKATNNGSTAATGNFTFTNQAKLNAGALGVVTNFQTSQSLTIAVGATSPVTAVGGSSRASNTYSTNLSQFLTRWIGGASDNGSEGLSFNGGNLSAVFTDSGAVGVNVTYTYSPAPVPEPGTIALVGIGLLALGLVRAKRA